MRSRTLLATFALAGALAPAAAGAPALVLDAIPGVSSWQVAGLPDLDQLRADSSSHPSLPEQGRNYCAPTSGANILAALGAMGQTDGVIDGTLNWQDNANYDAAVMSLRQVGSSMRTDKDTGTTSGNAQDGMQAHLSRYARAAGTRVTRRSVFSTSSPEAGDLVEIGRNGALFMVSYGYYRKHDDAEGIWWERTGGHALTAVAAQATRRGAIGSVTVHDPWTGSYDTTQSPFSADVKPLAERGRMRLKYEGNFYTIDVTPWNGSETQFLEGYIAVYPERLWVIRPGKITRFTPEPLLEDEPRLDEIPTPTSGAVDAAPTPGGSLLVLGRRGKIVHLGSGSGQQRTAARTIASVAGATQIATLPDGAIITAGAGRVTYLPEMGTRKTFPLPQGSVTDLAFDARRGTVEVLLDGRSIISLDGRTAKRRALKGNTARYLNVTAKGVVASPRLLTSAGRSAGVSAAGVVRLGAQSWRAGRGARVVATWVMPDGAGEFPGILDGGATHPDPPDRPNLQLIPRGPGAFVVKNTGPSPAPASWLEITRGQERTLQEIAPLAANEESALQAVACAGEFTARADAKGDVAESVEADNSLTLACARPA